MGGTRKRHGNAAERKEKERAQEQPGAMVEKRKGGRTEEKVATLSEKSEEEPCQKEEHVHSQHKRRVRPIVDRLLFMILAVVIFTAATLLSFLRKLFVSFSTYAVVSVGDLAISLFQRVLIAHRDILGSIYLLFAVFFVGRSWSFKRRIWIFFLVIAGLYVGSNLLKRVKTPRDATCLQLNEFSEEIFPFVLPSALYPGEKLNFPLIVPEHSSFEEGDW